MKKLYWPASLIIILALAFGSFSTVKAASADGLPTLKAVLLVGPIDGDSGNFTQQEIRNMEETAAELESHGVTVYRFYTPNNDWEQIKTAAEGAQFLFYRGHGLYWSEMPTPNVGGFALKDQFISGDDIRQGLHLAPGAIVMLYGCFTAGSSSNDASSISSSEALRRVAQYSAPFFDAGAGAYYADWYGDAFTRYVQSLFAGETLKQAYQNFYDFNQATVEQYTHPNFSNVTVWLDKDNWNGVQYNDAFAAARPDATLQDLFAAPAVIEAAPIYILSRPDQNLLTYEMMITSSTVQTFSWNAFLDNSENWVGLSKTSGTNGDVLSLTFTPSNQETGIYTNTLHIQTITSGNKETTTTVPVKMVVADQYFNNYLPSAMR